MSEIIPDSTPFTPTGWRYKEGQTQFYNVSDETFFNLVSEYALNVETTAREASDTALQNNIYTEATTRENEDVILQNQINQKIGQSEISNYLPARLEYIATGAEGYTKIFTELIGRSILEAVRGSELQIITAGTPATSSYQVKFDSVTGTLTFPSDLPLSAGELIIILHQPNLGTSGNTDVYNPYPESIAYTGEESISVNQNGLIIDKTEQQYTRTTTDELFAPKYEAFSVQWQNASAPIRITGFGADLAYTSWPFSNTLYDPARDQIVKLYMDGSHHSPTDLTNPATYDMKVRCMIQANASTYTYSAGVSPFGTAQTIYSEYGVNSFCQSFTLLPSGRYLAIITRLVPNTESSNSYTQRAYCYSDDGGVTWANTPMTDNNGAAILGLYSYALLTLQDGSVCFMNMVPAAGPIQGWEFYKSTSGLNGTFQKIWVSPELNRPVLLRYQTEVVLAGSDRAWIPFEPIIREVAPNQLLCYWRPTANGINTTNARAIYSKSMDGGLTWTAIYYSSFPAAANNTSFGLTNP